MSRSYGVVGNSRSVCWRWLFQTWKFRPFGFNLFTIYHQRLWVKGYMGVEGDVGVRGWKL